MATTKIKDLLKCIVNCPELYRLFETVTKNFDYPAAKSECLVSVNDGVLPTDCVVLPETVGRRLAFIFCLLVEFDKDTVNFNDFLRLYFPEDGSYFASYRAFCNIIIKGFRNASCKCLKTNSMRFRQASLIPIKRKFFPHLKCLFHRKCILLPITLCLPRTKKTALKYFRDY